MYSITGLLQQQQIITQGGQYRCKADPQHRLITLKFTKHYHCVVTGTIVKKRQSGDKEVSEQKGKILAANPYRGIAPKKHLYW